MRRGWVRISVGGLLLFFMAGCSEPPAKEHDQAVAAIAAARSAGAATYATEDLAAAEASLKRYDGFVAQRDYKQALNSALDARDRSYDAAKTATAKRNELRAEATRLMGVLDAALETADAELKAPRSPAAAKRVTKLRQTRKATVLAMQEARAELTSGELQTAVRRLGDAIAALNRDTAALAAITRTSKR